MADLKVIFMKKIMATNFISSAARDAIQQWLDHERAIKASADNTIAAYAKDVTRFWLILFK